MRDLVKTSLGIVGFGPFAQFITPYLHAHFDIWVWNRSDQSRAAAELQVAYATLETVISKKIVILCTNASFFEELLRDKHHLFNPHGIVVDVASVKIKPVELMLKYLPETCQILGTHPLFGPQSGKYGIRGLNLVLCPVRTTKGDVVFDFLSNTLNLNVMVRTPEAHDKEMAYVQALTHFIGRAVSQMEIPDLEQKTKAYQSLLDIKSLLGKDSFDLFTTIENENPFAASVREQFMSQLKGLDESLKKKIE